MERYARDDGVTSDEGSDLARLRRENTRLRQERDLLKSRGLRRDGERDPVSMYRLIAAQKPNPVSVACELLGVSRSGLRLDVQGAVGS